MTSLNDGISLPDGGWTASSRRARPAGRRSREAAGGEAQAQGMPLLVTAFIVSLVIPVTVNLGPIALMPFRIVLILAFLPLAARFFASGSLKLQAFDWMILGWVAWATLALFVNHGLGIVEFAGSRVVEVLGAWMVGRVGVRSAEDMRRVARLLFGIAMFLLPFAALESFTGRRVIIDLLPATPRMLETVPRWGLERANVVFVHPILFGVFVISSLGLGWYVLFWSASFSKKLGRALLLFAGTFFSLSAGALVGYAVQALTIGWDTLFHRLPRHWMTYAKLWVGTYVALDILSNRSPFHLIVDYLTFSSGSAYNRILIWRYGTQNVQDNPVFGIGLNDWARPGWMGSSVDNFWLFNAMQFGLPGFVFLALGVVMLMRGVVKSPLNDPKEHACRVGWATTIWGLTVAGGTVHYWTAILCLFVFLLASGGWLVRPAEERTRATPHLRGRGQRRDPGGRASGADRSAKAGSARRAPHALPESRARP